MEGEDASNTHVRERQVGFRFFQHYALFRHMTVFDNIAFGMRMKHKSVRPGEAQIKAKVHELLNLVQLDWLADRLPTHVQDSASALLWHALWRWSLGCCCSMSHLVHWMQKYAKLRRWLRRLHDELHITSIFVTR